MGISKQPFAAPSSGYHVPAEESRHQRTFMQWPNSRDVYPESAFLNIVQDTIADIANAISAFKPVVMLAAADHHKQARRKLASKVELWDIPTEDLWCRDSGPIFVINKDGQLAISHIQFNWLGAKTGPYQRRAHCPAGG